MASATDATPVREKVAVLGLGRLGLCFAVVLEQAGYDVVGWAKLPVTPPRICMRCRGGGGMRRVAE